MRLLALVLFSILLAGCSYGVESAPSQNRPMGPENTSAPPIPETWLGQVCAAVAPAVGPAPPATDGNDLAASRDRMVAYLAERARALDDAIDRVNDAGPAPVENGQSTTDSVVDLLRQRTAAVRESREALAAVPANDPMTLAVRLEGARSALILPGPEVLRDLALPVNLTDEATQVHACRELSRPT